MVLDMKVLRILLILIIFVWSHSGLSFKLNQVVVSTFQTLGVQNSAHNPIDQSTIETRASKRGRYPILQLWKSHVRGSNIYQDSITSASVLQRFSFSDNEIASIFQQFEPLQIKIDVLNRLIPILLFLNNTCSYVSENCRKNEILKYPQILGLELESTIACRHSFLRYYKIPLYHITSSGEEEWMFPSYLLMKEGEFVKSFASSCSTNSTTFMDYTTFRSYFLRGGLSLIKQGQFTLLPFLLEHGYNPEDDLDRQGRSVLMWLVANPSQSSIASVLPIFDMLIDFHLNVQENLFGELQRRTVSGETLLHHVTLNAPSQSYLLFQKLIALYDQYNISKQMIHAVNDEGTHLLHWAAGNGCYEIIDYLLRSHCTDNTTYNLSKDLGSSDYAQSQQSTYIGRSESLLHVDNEFGCTMIHFAASGGQLHVLKYLSSQHNYHPIETLINHHGHDALTKAIAFQQNHVAQWLLETFPSVRKSVSDLRPWNEFTNRMQKIKAPISSLTAKPEMKSLLAIAEFVGNLEGVQLLQNYI
jgi:ankyrin repeat protein